MSSNKRVHFNPCNETQKIPMANEEPAEDYLSADETNRAIYTSQSKPGDSESVRKPVGLSVQSENCKQSATCTMGKV